MTATNDQIVAEANRRALERGWDAPPVEHCIVEVVREGWTPPEPVDPDVLAYREWAKSKNENATYREAVLAGRWDHCPAAIGFLAGARMAREQEQERAKVLLKALYGIRKHGDDFEAGVAQAAIDTYKAGKEAGK